MEKSSFFALFATNAVVEDGFVVAFSTLSLVLGQDQE